MPLNVHETQDRLARGAAVGLVLAFGKMPLDRCLELSVFPSEKFLVAYFDLALVLRLSQRVRIVVITVLLLIGASDLDVTLLLVELVLHL